MIMIGKDFENPWGLTTTKGKIRMMSSIMDSAVFLDHKEDIRACNCC